MAYFVANGAPSAGLISVRHLMNLFPPGGSLRCIFLAEAPGNSYVKRIRSALFKYVTRYLFEKARVATLSILLCRDSHKYSEEERKYTLPERISLSEPEQRLKKRGCIFTCVHCSGEKIHIVHYARGRSKPCTHRQTVVSRFFVLGTVFPCQFQQKRNL